MTKNRPLCQSICMNESRSRKGAKSTKRIKSENSEIAGLTSKCSPPMLLNFASVNEELSVVGKGWNFGKVLRVRKSISLSAKIFRSPDSTPTFWGGLARPAFSRIEGTVYSECYCSAFPLAKQGLSASNC